MHDNIRGVKLTPASHRHHKIGLPVEGLTYMYKQVIGVTGKNDVTPLFGITKTMKNFY